MSSPFNAPREDEPLQPRDAAEKPRAIITAGVLPFLSAVAATAVMAGLWPVFYVRYGEPLDLRFVAGSIGVVVAAIVVLIVAIGSLFPHHPRLVIVFTAIGAIPGFFSAMSIARSTSDFTRTLAQMHCERVLERKDSLEACMPVAIRCVHLLREDGTFVLGDIYEQCIRDTLP